MDAHKGLLPYVLENASIGEVLLQGNQSSVVKAYYCGVYYHGNKLNSFECKVSKKDDNSSRLKSVCDLLSNLRHPNLVQFIGIILSPVDTVPVLVYEALPYTVTSALDHYSLFPATVQTSIANDVARAMVYLHSKRKPVIHGNITASNVFLSSGLQAKVGDLGVDRLFDPSSSRVIVTRTKSSEATAYSPPEASHHSSNLSPWHDVFSFGVLLLHMACGKCPIPSETGLSDFDQRRRYLDSIKQDHCLISLIKDCLSKEPKNRPNSTFMLQKCEELSRKNPLPFTTALELMQRMERREGELISMVERLEYEQKEVAGIGKQLNTYDEQLTAVKEQMKTMEKELADNIKEMPLNQVLNKILLPQKDTSKTNLTVDAGNDQSRLLPELKPTQSVFQWKSSSKAPIGMRGASAVVLEGKMYIGGGETRNIQNDCVLYEYDITGLVHKWTAFPPCPVAYYALGIVNRSLVLIGGLEVATRRPSNKLYLWDREKQDWTLSLPNMVTAKLHSSAAMYDLLLIVAGGYRNKKVLGEVEAFDQATFEWQTLPPLQVPCAGATSCIVRDVLYLIGGTLYEEMGPKTIVQSLSLSTTDSQNKTWSLCKDAPLTQSCAVPASNFILAVGGSITGSNVPSRAINVYFPSLDRWTLLCEMPTARSLCIASVMSAGRLFIYGGREERSEYGDTLELLLV